MKTQAAISAANKVPAVFNIRVLSISPSHFLQKIPTPFTLTLHPCYVNDIKTVIFARKGAIKIYKNILCQRSAVGSGSGRKCPRLPMIDALDWVRGGGRIDRS